MRTDMDLLRQLCTVHAPSGNEIGMKEFIKDYIKQNQSKWLVQPEIVEGDFFQDSFLLKFGKPATAIFAHMDSIGFTVRYKNEVVKIGGPVTEGGIKLVGKDSIGDIHCVLK